MGAKTRGKAKLAAESLLGLSRDEVRKRFGKPNRRGDDFDSFFPWGVAIYYDAAGKVEQVSASHFVSGGSFRGTVLGVALGDSKERCIAAWGSKPVRVRKNVREEHTDEKWTYQDYVIEVQMWKSDGQDDEFRNYGGIPSRRSPSRV